MNILQTFIQLRDDLKIWVTTNLNALNAKIDEKTISIDNKLDSSSTNPVQNKTITEAINNIPKFSGDYNDLIHAPNIAEDESGNMVIADESGNIIFKADANGIHTTAVSINGEVAASEKYVDEAIANIDIPEVDFTGYATENFVTVAVDAVKEELSESIASESAEWKVVDGNGNIIFSVDADGAHTTELTLDGKEAATKEYVDNVFNGIEIPETDFTGYATENYVDNKVADLVNSAPEALNTLGELAIAIENHEDAYDALLETIGNKATHADLENLKEELSESIVAETEDWKVVDGNGNIIFSVDANGAHTTALSLNGESVKDMLDDKVDKIEGKGLSTNDFTNEYKSQLDNLTFEETDPTVPAWAKTENKPEYTADEVGALSKSTILADLSDDTNHRTVSDTEKITWNAKSDFSGDYNDLTNAPNITEDGTGDLVIADANGNIIFRSNGSGFETVNLTVQNITINGMTIQEMIRTSIEEIILGGEW